MRQPKDTKVGRVLFPVALVAVGIGAMGVKVHGLGTWWAWVAFAVGFACGGIARLAFRHENGPARAEPPAEERGAPAADAQTWLYALVPAFVLPPVGLVIGLYQLSRKDADKAPALTAVVVGGALSALILAAVLSN